MTVNIHPVEFIGHTYKKEDSLDRLPRPEPESRDVLHKPAEKSERSPCIMQGKTFAPIEYKALVLPDLIEDTDEVRKSAKSAGIVMIDKEESREQDKQVYGTLIAVGGKAFSDMGDPSPQIGDRVCFAKFAGLVIKADDEREYRLINDKDVAGILR